MFSRSVWTLALSLLLAGAGLFQGTRVAAATPPEVKRLHILMVFDTEAADLKLSLQVDERRMRRLWLETIPASRYTLTVLKGKQVTRKEVLAHYEKAKVGPGDGLLFYYAGHGAVDRKTREHHFDLMGDKALSRKDVLRAMEAKKADLVVMLTDCCSTPQVVQGNLATPKGVPSPATKIHPTVRDLLFRTRGTVDVTAASDNASWSDNNRGGLFTRSLDRMFREEVGTLDGNRDGMVTWREFFPQLRDETRSLFGAWRKEMVARGEKVDERTQRPRAFALGRLLGVVGIENATRGPLNYRWRWAGQDQWNEVTLPMGEKRLHSFPINDPESPLPQLETRFDGIRKASMLRPVEWTGSGEPADLVRYYRIRSRAK